MQKMRFEHSRTAGIQGDLPVRPLDFTHLRRYTLGNEALEAEILGLFQAQLSSMVSALRTAASQSEWKTATHTLKGSSRAVGAWEIGDLAEAAENMACPGEQSARSATIEKIELAVADADSFIAGLLQRGSAAAQG
jgi:HPt (histidine-containing phosphotransfer) domain-containing protein